MYNPMHRLALVGCLTSTATPPRNLLIIDVPSSISRDYFQHVHYFSARALTPFHNPRYRYAAPDHLLVPVSPRPSLHTTHPPLPDSTSVSTRLSIFSPTSHNHQPTQFRFCRISDCILSSRPAELNLNASPSSPRALCFSDAPCLRHLRFACRRCQKASNKLFWPSFAPFFLFFPLPPPLCLALLL